MSTGLFVMTHKQLEDNHLFIDRKVMLVGAQGKSFLLSYNDNDFSDNISTKNENYCELTGLYDIWKNRDYQIVGLEHYRRLFISRSIINPHVLSAKEIERILHKKDIIVPYPYKYSASLIEEYKQQHYIEDLDRAYWILKKKYPDYDEAYLHIMNQNCCSLANMFIAKKAVIDQYCSFLFDILFELEQITDLSHYDVYQRRIYGFLSERLFNVWLYHNRSTLKIEYRPLIVTGGNNFFLWNLQNIIKTIIHREGINHLKHIKP